MVLLAHLALMVILAFPEMMATLDRGYIPLPMVGFGVSSYDVIFSGSSR